MVYLLKMVIFYSYVKLPEGTIYYPCLGKAKHHMIGYHLPSHSHKNIPNRRPIIDIIALVYHYTLIWGVQ